MARSWSRHLANAILAKLAPFCNVAWLMGQLKAWQAYSEGVGSMVRVFQFLRQLDILNFL